MMITYTHCHGNDPAQAQVTVNGSGAPGGGLAVWLVEPAGLAATDAATRGYTCTAPANPDPKSAGTISTSRPGSGAWIIFPWPR